MACLAIKLPGAPRKIASTCMAARNTIMPSVDLCGSQGLKARNGPDVPISGLGVIERTLGDKSFDTAVWRAISAPCS